MFCSIQWRITTLLVLLTLGSIGFLGLYLVNSARDTQIDNLRAQLENEARLVAQASLPGLTDPETPDEPDNLAKTLEDEIGARVTIIALNGAVLGDSEEDPNLMENHADRPEVIDALASGLGESTRYSTTLGQQLMYLAVPVVTSQGDTVGVARVSLPLTTVEDVVGGVTRPIMAALGITAGLAVLAAALISRSISQPLKQVTGAARKIAEGELNHKIPVRSGDEVGQMARAFNEMSLSLKNLVAGISGERSKLAIILSSMADGVVMTDSEGNTTFANHAAERLFGFRADKARGRNFIEVVPDYEIAELLKKCLKTAREQTAQLEAGRGKRFLRVIALPLVGDRLTEALVLFQDLTELRNLQTMRRELVGNIAHELRTPLANIKAIVETIKDGSIDDKQMTRDFLTRVDGEVDRMTQIVAELTELSRIESGKAELKLEEIDLNLITREVVTQLTPFAERRGVAVDLEPAPDLPPVVADRERVRQVVTNLLHNALKFTPKGGRVVISSQVENGSATVSISDTGIGISQEDLPHVFERFYKADKARSGGGTGMGLAIAKHIIQAHGGTIRARSEARKGSTFSFSLPAK
ncbi:MAG: HAMP domain-containing protein [Dehalococcoidales bacterium]|nr:HAMP domain-containing protein [Dehalococcoidales bacterium]